MIADAARLLAQKPDLDWTNLLYLLVFLIFPALNSLGERLRKRFGKSKTQPPPAPGAPVIGEPGKRLDSPPGRTIVIMQQPPPAPATHPRSRPAVQGRPARPVVSGRLVVRRAPSQPPPRRPLPVQPPDARPAQRRLRPQPPAAPQEGRSVAAPVEASGHALSRLIAQADQAQRRQTRPGSATQWVRQAITPAHLRHIVVLNEILQPPLALRRDLAW